MYKRQIQDLLGRMKWEVLQHSPFIPDLSPCDYHVFGPLKKSLKGRRFKSDSEVEFAVSEWFRKHPQDFTIRAVSYTHLDVYKRQL